LNTIEAAAKKAAVSPATSEPGLSAVILKDGYSYWTYSGGYQNYYISLIDIHLNIIITSILLMLFI